MRGYGKYMDENYCARGNYDSEAGIMAAVKPRGHAIMTATVISAEFDTSLKRVEARRNLFLTDLGSPSAQLFATEP
jgi:hypothetical protein